jgi:hypothetical protein
MERRVENLFVAEEHGLDREVMGRTHNGASGQISLATCYAGDEW